MLFNSHVFILVFLPAVVAGFYILARAGLTRFAIAWLVGASLFFYGWWNPVYLGLLIGSIAVNYTFGLALARRAGSRGGAYILGLGVAANLLTLGYFKYANFFLANVGALAGVDWTLGAIVLPLGISFFTFQQIAYLVDCKRREAHESDFLDYCLFVSFFPQLIAGPIVHHKEMMPQFSGLAGSNRAAENLTVGLTVFFIGLFKKIMVADNIARFSSPVFAAAANGTDIGFHSAWQGALGYTVQIYFDFSGYSDMAIGLARMFGIRLPLNFDSPYKATNIIEFWRRWHMTLSRFLRDYLYYPLGGNRKGGRRRHLNLITVMILGGLWHGAAWTFVLWGALHGLYLAANHFWIWLRPALGLKTGDPSRAGLWAGRLITMLAVIVAWVFFRAENFDAAMTMLRGMAGMADTVEDVRRTSLSATLACVLLLLYAMLAPNTQQIMAKGKPALAASTIVLGRWTSKIVWRPNRGFAVAMAVIALAGILGAVKTSEFLYFQF